MVSISATAPAKPNSETQGFFSPHKDSGPGGNVDLTNSEGSEGSDKKFNPSPTGKGTQSLDMNKFPMPDNVETPDNALDALDFGISGFKKASENSPAPTEPPKNFVQCSSCKSYKEIIPGKREEETDDIRDTSKKGITPANTKIEAPEKYHKSPIPVE